MPAVPFQHAPRHEQPLTQTARVDQFAALGTGFTPVELFKDVRQITFDDAHTGIDKLD